MTPSSSNHAGQTSLLHQVLLQVNFLSLLSLAETDGRLGIYTPSETPSLPDPPAADQKLPTKPPFLLLGHFCPPNLRRIRSVPLPLTAHHQTQSVTHLRIRRV